MSKLEVETTRDEFIVFYESLEYCNKGLVIGGKPLLFKSKMSYGISRNVRDLRVRYETDRDHNLKILKLYNDDILKLRDTTMVKTPKGQYVFIEGKEQEADEEVKKLNEVHKTILDESKKFLKEKDKFNIFMVDSLEFAELPQNIADDLFLMRLE
jgi:hypothetical protein